MPCAAALRKKYQATRLRVDRTSGVRKSSAAIRIRGMSLRLLKSVTKASQRVLEHLVDGLDVGESKKVDNGGPFMAVLLTRCRRM